MDNLQKSMNNPSLYVEFYGLPGCGKSTISHVVAEKMRYAGYIVNEPSYDLDHGNKPVWRKIKKLWLTFVYLVFHNRTFNSVSRIVSDNGYNGKAKLEQISNVIQKLIIYRERTLSHAIIWDQGLVQAAISLSLNGKMEAAANLNRLVELLPSDINWLNILIDVDENLSLQRMTMRKTNDSRVERIKDKDKKHQMMSCFVANIDSISKSIDVFIVDGKINLEQQANQIYDIVFHRLCL